MKKVKDYEYFRLTPIPTDYFKCVSLFEQVQWLHREYLQQEEKIKNLEEKLDKLSQR